MCQQPIYQDNVVALVVDEANCVKEMAKDMRLREQVLLEDI